MRFKNSNKEFKNGLIEDFQISSYTKYFWIDYVCLYRYYNYYTFSKI